MSFTSRRGWWVLTAVTMVWLLGMTMWPDNTPNKINLIPLAEPVWALTCLFNRACSARQAAFWYLLINGLGNIVVFMPLGLGLAGLLRQNRPWPTIGRATLGGGLFSLAIELMQLTISTRATDIDDLIFNTLGAALGALSFVIVGNLWALKRVINITHSTEEIDP
jgi:glycopeptide antibiotics resistance protein